MGPAEERAAALLERARDVVAKIEGETRVAGIAAPVEILRDQWGVPHIYAASARDLFFAQGFCVAQDRLFQLDLWRRVARGETAELLGDEAIEADRFARLVRYRGDMDTEWKSYSPDTREIATAFTDGINAWIDQVGERLPIEFQLVGHRPEHWVPEDILGRMSGIIMSGNWEKEVARSRLIQAVGARTARLLAPTDPRVEFEADPELDLALVTEQILLGYRAATRVLKFTPSSSESNNWVIAGSLSESGKPMLASDPHRATTLPSLRYLAHLHAPGWHVIGAGEPALPGVALGHNERIAWGLTIVGTDQTDLFVERTKPGDPRQYLVDDRWEPMKVVQETIRVKGSHEPLSIELRFTRHGPVIHQDEQQQVAVAMKWAGSEPGGAAYLASLAVARAQNREQFLAAAARWRIPSLNIVYADVEGGIGWIAAGAVPVRRSGNGLLPVPGETEKYDWERYLQVSELPQSFDPPQGWIATANHNILPPGYRHLIAHDWSNPYRFRRIQERLTAKRSFSAADFRDMQHDAGSFPGRILQAVVKEVRFPVELARHVDLFLAWDGELSIDSKAGPLHAVWVQELLSAMYRPHAEMDETTDRTDLRSVQVILEHLAEPTEAWFGPDPVGHRDALVRETFAAAVDRTRRLLGADPDTWRWGKLHTATFHHVLESLGPEYAKALNLGPVPRAGDANTPLNTRHDKEFRQVHGATYRHVVDLADWDRAVATSAPGQSGQPGSPHYDDLLPLWAAGEYFPLAFSREKVEQVTRHRLRLVPPP